MSEGDFRKEAEEHWQFVEQLLRLAIFVPTKQAYSELIHYLYVEAMIHGFRHGQERNNGKI
jgi:hypothetical protein